MSAFELFLGNTAGLLFEEKIGRYVLSCKIGNVCNFGIDQISNQTHYHSSFELCIVTKGEAVFLCNERTYQLSGGDVIVADPEMSHEIRSHDRNGMQLLYLFFTVVSDRTASTSKNIEETIIQDFLTSHSQYSSSQNALLTYLTFISQYQQQKGRQLFAITRALRSFVIECMAALSNARSSFEPIAGTASILERALDYIDQNLQNNLRVEDIASHACTSQRNLEHLFKKSLNKTVIAYFNEKKVRLACHYLEMHFGIAETGALIGIHDLSQFSRLFKKVQGLSPSAYQRAQAAMLSGMGRREV